MHIFSIHLQGVLGQLMNFESRRGQDENIADDEQNKYAVNLYKEGGVDVSFVTNIKCTIFL